MKGRLVAFAGIFCIACLIVSGAYAAKPDKPDKPDKPGGTKAECIFFRGDLESEPDEEVIEGCCPNAGPWPAYTMTMTLNFADEYKYEYLNHQYVGQLFMNGIGSGPRAPDAQYKVQFWSWDSDIDTPGPGDIFFQIYGGDIVEDKKNKYLRVSFTDEEPTLWLYDDWVAPNMCCAIEVPVLPVTFELVRTSDLTDCGQSE